ncbi:VWA domain-containing protein, partial [Bordetella pertussis]
MQDWAERLGVALRPHAKAHKCPEVALRQLALGARGICCQKVSEALPFVAAGVRDIHISNEVVGPVKLALLGELARQADISVCVDHPDNLEALAQAMERAGARVTVLVEVDVGQGRCGVTDPQVVLALALARPQWVEPPLTHVEPMRDILLVVDISQSMDSEDFRDAQGRPASRWQAVQAVVGDFIDKRPDDRLGLIVFGAGAYPQAPLTRDHAALRLLLQRTAVGMAGPNTALGDAIGLGIRMLDHAGERDKILILLTDGNDTASAVPPARAAELAAQHRVVVHTIGIGDPAASGEDRVDFDALRDIARIAGGRFFRARDQASLQEVYATLDRITPHEVRTLRHQPKREDFWMPLGAALALLALWHGG